jgi:SAM-dependent methyltransferase
MSVTRFYDDLAADYHLIFADWRAEVLRQGDILDRLIRSLKGGPPLTVLDCACGIGTQAIGLALRGYTVHATDISPAAVERAKAEAESFGAALTFGVADVRTLAEQVHGTFDAVIACDNALPHLLTDADLAQAARSMAATLKPGGLLLASIRDYDRILQERPTATLPQTHDGPDGRRVTFQTWDWDSELYTLNHFILKQDGDGWQTAHRATQYRALRRVTLTAALEAAGLDDVRWHTPEASGYYQPVVTARKGDAEP